MKGYPISPDEILATNSVSIPPEVFNVVNELLTLKYTSRFDSIIILQSEIIAKIKERMSDFQYEWLDFEDAYRNVGWDVEYDRAACETYPRSFIFNKRANGNI